MLSGATLLERRSLAQSDVGSLNTTASLQGQRGAEGAEGAAVPKGYNAEAKATVNVSSFFYHLPGVNVNLTIDVRHV
jgi:hypothetical protein